MMTKLVLRNRDGAEISSVSLHIENGAMLRHERQEEVECAFHSLFSDMGWILMNGDTITVESDDRQAS